MIRIMFVKKWLGFRNGLQTQVSSLSGWQLAALVQLYPTNARAVPDAGVASFQTRKHSVSPSLFF